MKTTKADGERGASRPETGSDAKTAPSDSVDGGDNDRLVGRAEAAGVLGVSIATLRRLERTVLRPVVDANGMHRHSVRRLLDYKAERANPIAGADDCKGAQAAAAFEHFDRSLGPADVVKLLKVTPNLARELHGDWADLGGGFVVSGEIAARIDRLGPKDDGAPVTNGAELLRLLERPDVRTNRSVQDASGELRASASVASCTARHARSGLRRRRSLGPRRARKSETRRNSNGR
jgi:hypothetical protein